MIKAKLKEYLDKSAEVNADTVLIIDKRIKSEFDLTAEYNITVNGEKLIFAILLQEDEEFMVIVTPYLNDKNNSAFYKEMYHSLKDLGIKNLRFYTLAYSTDNSKGWFKVSDHANLTGYNPLIGKNEESYGTRFPDMSNAYEDKNTGIAIAGLALKSEIDNNIKEFLKNNNIILATDTLIYDVIIARHCGQNCKASVFVK